MLSQNAIKKLLAEVNDKLEERGKYGEIVIAGGATLALVYNARESTKDIDALFRPSQEFREIINEIADENKLDSDWLNDGVKGFFTNKMKADLYHEYSNLMVYTVDAESMLALKLTSARYASKDMEDSVFLMKHIGIKSEDELFDIIEKYTSKNQQTVNSYYFAKEAFVKYQREIQRESVGQGNDELGKTEAYTPSETYFLETLEDFEPDNFKLVDVKEQSDSEFTARFEKNDESIEFAVSIGKSGKTEVVERDNRSGISDDAKEAFAYALQVTAEDIYQERLKEKSQREYDD